MSVGNDFITTRDQLEKRVGQLLCAFISMHEPNDIAPWCSKFQEHVADKIKGCEVHKVGVSFEQDANRVHCHIEVKMDCGAVELHHRYTFTQVTGGEDNADVEEGEEER
ncbi:hypothetical protein GR11A_00198 [Vibrio phage vB_VcorM_GR11A]|nr:hypothetical protein GR11A_00198 [Vibrio phage vB_VcorM_GR11A]